MDRVHRWQQLPEVPFPRANSAPSNVLMTTHQNELQCPECSAFFLSLVNPTALWLHPPHIFVAFFFEILPHCPTVNLSNRATNRATNLFGVCPPRVEITRLKLQFGLKSAWPKSATQILAEVGQIFLAKVGLGKVGISQLAKVEIGRSRPRPLKSALHRAHPWPLRLSQFCELILLHLTKAPASRQTRTNFRSIGSALERDLPLDQLRTRTSVIWSGNLILSRSNVRTAQVALGTPPQLGIVEQRTRAWT